MECVISQNDGNLRTLLVKLQSLPVLAERFANDEVYMSTKRIVSSIPCEGTILEQLGRAIEAIELEDYALWPPILKHMISEIANTFLLVQDTPSLHLLQRLRYAELRSYPHICAQLVQGFTRVLPLSEPTSFISELISAGKRQLPRDDEANPMNEEGVLHVALSYKHASGDHLLGTISETTALEAYEIIVNMIGISVNDKVRVWVDQNLHRYPENKFGPWYERGLLPYAVLNVVSTLTDCGGFSICRTSPWIWVETSLAAGGSGINCRQKLYDTLQSVFSFKSSASSEKTKTVCGRPANSIYLGQRSSVVERFKKGLLVVSFWTPDILDHKGYRYVEEFSAFVSWARMQLIRLRYRGRLGHINSDKVGHSLIEKLAWLKSVPYLHSTLQKKSDPYLKIEGSRIAYDDILALLKVSNICTRVGDHYQIVNGLAMNAFIPKRSHLYFSFIESSDGSVQFDVPLDVERHIGASTVMDLTSRDLSERTTNIFRARGSYAPWDCRFDKGRVPEYCGVSSIFDLGDELRKCKVDLDKILPNIGDIRFEKYGYSSRLDDIETVYKASFKGVSRLISESDMICISLLGKELAYRFMAELMDDRIFDAVALILKSQKHMQVDEWIWPDAFGSSGETIWKAIRNTRSTLHETGSQKKPITYTTRLGRIYIGKGLCHMVAFREDIGIIKHTFQTKGTREMTTEALGKLNYDGDVDHFFRNVKVIMDGQVPLALPRKEIDLIGWEIRYCLKCLNFFSPVNNHTCILATRLDTKEIEIEWMAVHQCMRSFEIDHIPFQFCWKCSNVFSPGFNRVCVLYSDLKSRIVHKDWKMIHNCKTSIETMFSGRAVLR